LCPVDQTFYRDQVTALLVPAGADPSYIDRYPPTPEDFPDNRLAARLYSHVQVAAAPAGRWFLGACWVYAGNTSGGYGRIRVNRKLRQAHIVAWEQEHGPIPPKLTLDHLCHDEKLCLDWRKCPHRACVRYDHLGLVTRPVNATRNLSPPAIHGRATHCIHGHPLSGPNLVIRMRRGRNGAQSRPRRQCRTCLREAWNRWNDRLNAQEAAREAAAGVR
jgi:hypothetical protein